MKKILFTFIFSILIQPAFANMWPILNSNWAWWLYFSSGNLLSENVSVEKEVLVFKTSDKNIFKKDAKYLWYEYLMKKLKVSKNFIEKNLTTIDNWDEHNNIDEKLWFIGVENDYTWWSINIWVRYYLKNNSDKEMKDQKIWFSFFKNTSVNASLIPYSDNIYVLNSENNYPTNFKVYDWNKSLSISNSYMSEEFKNTNSSWQILNSVKKISTFNVSFQPNESKILTITYSIPFKLKFNGDKYVDYDFSPIFNWKGWNVKNVFIAIFWDDNNILYKSLSNIAFDIVWKNKYVKNLENINKTSNIDNIEIFFSNQKELIERWFCWLWCINSSFFCSEQDNSWNYFGESITVSASKDPQKIVIKTNDGKLKEYDIFDVLK